MNTYKNSTTTISATIAIVGAGFSGTMVAVHLLRQATTPLLIYLIERQPTIGTGVAYSTPFDCHLLNVPAAKMSAFPDQPDHFLRWAQQQHCSPVQADTFVSRKLYGTYLQAVLRDAEQRSQWAQLKRIQDEAIAIQPLTQGLRLTLCQGSELRADQVVLAMGNLPPSNPPIADPTFYRSPRYISSAWSSTALSTLPQNASVLLVGSGLTAVDVLLKLYTQGHQGSVTLVSRRGLLPQAHRPFTPLPYSPLPGDRPQSARELLHQVRRSVRLAAMDGYDWRAVIDALRPLTMELWQALSLSEQQRWLRHVRPYWEVHRHRLAPVVAETVAKLQRSRQIQIWAGRIASFEEKSNRVTATIRLRGTQDTIAVVAERVINCTGPEANVRKFQHPLMAHLLNSGLIRSDELGLGLAVNDDGALRDAADFASERLYTLGPLCKGCRWETTAVPEIRNQALRLAHTLLAKTARPIDFRHLAWMSSAPNRPTA